jgi:hypothetical protein
LGSLSASAETPRPGPLTAAVASRAATPLTPQPRGSSRDSLKNGAVIGAVAGAAALGGFGLFLCHALDDTGGNPDCFPAVLGIAAVGAGIGAGAGIGIDALMSKRPRPAPAVRVRIRFCRFISDPP